MTFTAIRLCGAALAAVLALLSSPTRAQSDFYQGKTINFVISTDPGGGIDAYGRTLIAHMGKHIPGHPTLVAQNMPGAGGLRATRFLFNSAPTDGTTIGLIHSSMIDADLFHLKEPGFDVLKAKWLGNIGNSPITCIAWHTATANTIDDLRREEFVVGAAGAFSGSGIYPRVMNELLGTKLKIIAGYQSGGEVDLAMERGEIQGRCAALLASIQSSQPDWLTDRKVKFLIQFAPKRSPELPDTPTIFELTKTQRDRNLIEAIFGREAMNRPVLAPPNTPADRVQILRRAFDDTLRDPDFLAEAKKRGLATELLTGEECEIVVRDIHAKSPDIIAEAKKIVGEQAE